MNKKLKIVLIILCVLILLVLLPIFIEILVLRNNIYSVVNNETWISFLGSYIGGMIGGLCTLAAIYFSNKGLKDSIKADRKQSRINHRGFISTSTVQARIDFSNFNDLKPIRIIHNESYLKLNEYLKNEANVIKGMYINDIKRMKQKMDEINLRAYSFIIFSNVTENTMLECRFDMEIHKGEILSIERYTVPVIKGKETIAFLGYDHTIKEEQFMKYISIVYKTNQNEKMKYEYDFENFIERHILLDENEETIEIIIENKFQNINWTLISS